MVVIVSIKPNKNSSTEADWQFAINMTQLAVGEAKVLRLAGRSLAPFSNL